MSLTLDAFTRLRPCNAAKESANVSAPSHLAQRCLDTCASFGVSPAPIRSSPAAVVSGNVAMADDRKLVPLCCCDKITASCCCPGCGCSTASRSVCHGKVPGEKCPRTSSTARAMALSTIVGAGALLRRARVAADLSHLALRPYHQIQAGITPRQAGGKSAMAVTYGATSNRLQYQGPKRQPNII